MTGRAYSCSTTQSQPKVKVKGGQVRFTCTRCGRSSTSRGGQAALLKEGRPQMTSARREMRGWEIAARVVGALLCAAVAYIHIKDQGGIIGEKDPAYMQVGYYMLEVTPVVTAVMLVTRRRSLTAWFLAIGVAAGPFIGLVLTRTTGLPGAMDDIGNWSETLGLVSLFVEGALFALAAALFVRAVRSQPGLVPAYPQGDAAGFPSQRAEVAAEER